MTPPHSQEPSQYVAHLLRHGGAVARQLDALLHDTDTSGVACASDDRFRSVVLQLRRDLLLLHEANSRSVNERDPEGVASLKRLHELAHRPIYDLNAAFELY